MTTTSSNSSSSQKARKLKKHPSQTYIEESQNIILLLNRQGHITYASPALTQLMGYVPEELLGRALDSLAPRDEARILRIILKEVQPSPGRTLKAEVVLRCKDNTTRRFEGSLTNLLEVPGIEALLYTLSPVREGRLAPSTGWHNMGATDHFVQFYEHDDFLLHSLSGYVAAGLAANEGCIVIASAEHLRKLNELLQTQGWDIDAASKEGTYVTAEATEALSWFVKGEKLDEKRFSRIFGGLIEKTAINRPHVRVYGEMVALLWAEGKQTTAIQLEDCWNNLQHSICPFSLFCAYPIRSFQGDMHSPSFETICHQHSQVIPEESYTSLQSPDERLRAITHLQQQALSLWGEIAERKQAEEKLRISEVRYRRLFEASKDGILILHPRSGSITDANPAIAQLLGRSQEELIGQDIRQVLLSRESTKAETFLEELQQKRFLHYDSLFLPHPDGTPQYLECVCNLYKVDEHELIQCNIRDITERKQAEKALRKAEARLRFLAESMPQKVFIARPDGSIDYVNPQWYDFTGLPAEELLGWSWLQCLHPDDKEATLQSWLHSLKSGEPLEIEHRFRRANGVYCWHISRAIPIRDDTGQITTWIGSTTDIDEQKQLEERKNAFISMASHELKTPVTSLKGFTQILQRRLGKNADSQTLMFLNRMDSQLKKLTALITDLLDISKIEIGKLSFHKEPLDLDTLVQETVQNVQEISSTHHIQLQGSTNARIYGDRDRLEQVLINLLTNAMKYSPHADTVIIRLDRQDNKARIAVQDFGIGIAPEHHHNIFDRFYRVIDSEEQTYPGLGIGLYITRTIIERHEGQLWLESQKDKGSTFYVTLPLYD
ncbi:PAS domain S-box-containing protein [Thermosporothrix hazakensis]|jgi:PAS domain S-box-containing protein|uniref:histidine kinase n=1 Tax=Thermosporothrix hazakensis TaxID=644383 RepID=A0A326UCL1_THEHA|nr:PAS domain S-box protein [Thermosporothrix hazakensis]PZW34339.1 PAS domain S-box-containing protein [Thermosporothrix hazakensis]GCE46112.1 hypothetical protein KTH_09810 [Thermosporothrix hazakensis]